MHIVPQRIYGFSKLNNFFHVERHFAFMFYSIHHISWTKLCVVQTKGKQTYVLLRRRLPPVVRSVQTYIGGKLNEPLQMKYTIGIKCYDKAINVPHHLCIILEKLRKLYEIMIARNKKILYIYQSAMLNIA